VTVIHAYARVSTVDQDPRFQLDALNRARVDRIWQERRSAVDHRPELEAMLDALQHGDEVLVWKLDRLARSLRHLLDIIETITKAGASLRSLTEPIDTGSALGRMILQLLGSFAEFERGMIRERCAAGIVAAQARGVRFGRVPYLDRDRMADLLAQGMSHSAVARELGCHQATVSRLVARGEVHQPSATRRRRGSHL
jgi:DNA invertase Pin-like site-specific DNA recombinase